MRSLLLPLLFLSAILSGCATYRHIEDYPKAMKTAEVAVISKPMSNISGMPVGTFYDEERQIIISGHQEGLGAAMMFGPLGVLVADSANRSSAEKKFGMAVHGSTADVGAILREELAAALDGQRAPRWQQATGKGTLQLSPYAQFTVQKSGKARLYAILRAEAPGASGEPSWSVRYFARAPGEYTIEGADGWMAQDRFPAGIRTALSLALQACISDTHGNLTAAKTIEVKGQLPYLNFDYVAWRFVAVQETNDHVIARLLAGDQFAASGTHVLDRSDFKISPAKFDDPRK
jgi:hypothetical protein